MRCKNSKFEKGVPNDEFEDSVAEEFESIVAVDLRLRLLRGRHEAHNAHERGESAFAPRFEQTQLVAVIDRAQPHVGHRVLRVIRIRPKIHLRE